MIISSVWARALITQPASCVDNIGNGEVVHMMLAGETNVCNYSKLVNFLVCPYEPHIAR